MIVRRLAPRSCYSSRQRNGTDAFPARRFAPRNRRKSLVSCRSNSVATHHNVVASSHRHRIASHAPFFDLGMNPHPSPLTPPPSPLNPHPSPLTPHTSPLTPHPSPFHETFLHYFILNSRRCRRCRVRSSRRFCAVKAECSRTTIPYCIQPVRKSNRG